MLPLEGIKVVDLSRYIAGPYCGQLLGDLGADVIKVESLHGEPQRHTGPKVEGSTFYVMVMNRNKRGITLDLRSDEGKEVLTNLLKDADILIQNYRVGTMDKMGFSWEKLQEINPRLNMISISAFGNKGPWADHPGFDSLAQAIGGLMDRTGEEDGPPMLAGTFIMDYGTGMYAALAAVSAIRARELTGKGQMVDLSLLQTALSFQVDNIPWYKLQGGYRSRAGNDDLYTSPTSAYRTKDDKYVFIVAGGDAFFPQFMRVIGREELIDNPEYKTAAQRCNHRDFFEGIAKEWVLKHTRDEVVTILEKAVIPVAPVLSLPELVEFPQILENDMIIDVPHTGVGNIPQQGFVMNFSETPLKIRYGAPFIGEHTDEVLTEMGYSAEQINDFRTKKIIK